MRTIARRKALRHLPDITRVAMRLGYAIGVHGSLRRDIDLIAAPWADDVAEPKQLVDAICKEIDGMLIRPDMEPGMKPHGRRVWSIHFRSFAAHHVYIDLSVMPKYA